MEPVILLPDGEATLTIERTFRAPRALVWKMFADPFHLAQWWGPAGYTNPVCDLDFRVGGHWHHVMRGPDGRDLPTDSVFIDIAPPERIVYRNAQSKDEVWGGNPPPSFKRTLTFTEANGVTTLRLFAEFEDVATRDSVARRGFAAGTLESYAKLAAHLESLA